MRPYVGIAGDLEFQFRTQTSNAVLVTALLAALLTSGAGESTTDDGGGQFWINSKSWGAPLALAFTVIGTTFR
jgi:hypothetical protein